MSSPWFLSQNMGSSIPVGNGPILVISTLIQVLQIVYMPVHVNVGDNDEAFIYKANCFSCLIAM